MRQGNIQPLYFLYGTEDYFIEQFKTTLIESSETEVSDDVTTFDLTETAIQDVIIDVETLPFFNERKIIFAQNPVFLKTKQESLSFSHDVKQLENYIENPTPYSILVIVAPYEKVDQRKKITKTLKKHAVTINCNPIKENELRKWILFIAKQNNISLTEEALFLLESEFGNNLHILQREMEKLVLFVGEDKEVTKDEVIEIISTSLTYSALELVDAVLKKDLHTAIKIYKDLEKQQENPIGLIALLAYQFRIIYQVKLLKAKGYSLRNMQQSIKVHPYVIKLASARSGSFTTEKLSEIINELTNTDTKIKQGKMEKGIAFELLLYKLVST